MKLIHDTADSDVTATVAAAVVITSNGMEIDHHILLGSEYCYGFNYYLNSILTAFCSLTIDAIA